MKEHLFIFEVSPCDTNLYPDGPKSISEAKQLGRQLCPYSKKCKEKLNPKTGFQCVMSFGTQVAQYCINNQHPVEVEMKDLKKEFPSLIAPKGFVYSSDRKEFTIITDRNEALEKIEKFAKMVLESTDIFQKNPRFQVGNEFEDVLAHAMTPDGIDLRKIQELEGRFGTNAGRGCDVKNGPCSCGAWH